MAPGIIDQNYLFLVYAGIPTVKLLEISQQNILTSCDWLNSVFVICDWSWIECDIKNNDVRNNVIRRSVSKVYASSERKYKKKNQEEKSFHLNFHLNTVYTIRESTETSSRLLSSYVVFRFVDIVPQKR